MNPSVYHDQSALASAAAWLSNLLQGSFGTSLAATAVAILGYGLLRGDLQLRRGVRIIIGCFILFGAPFIANGLLGYQGVSTSFSQPPVPPAPLAMPPSPKQNLDPYAGASVPM